MAPAAPRLVLIALGLASLLALSAGTCVLDSDFGFILNCGFKKSGLFRVRNLGGVKGYVGLGFSVGDELRFNESLSNVEPTRRRSVPVATGRSASGGLPAPNAIPAPATPAPVAASAPAAAPAASDAQVKKRAESPDRRRAGSIRQLKPTVPPFKPIAPGPARPAAAAPAPAAAPALPLAASAAALPGAVSRPSRLAPAAAAAVPPFQALPDSITRVTPAPAPAVYMPPAAAFRQSLQAATHHFQVRKDVLPDLGLTANALSEPMKLVPAAAPAKPAPAAPVLPAATSQDAALLAATIQHLAKAANMSVETVAAALAARRQQIAASGGGAALLPTPVAAPAPAATTPSASAASATTRSPLASLSKVMNAPREYYPVGYDKNFDDNFASRVDLPDTSFYCGDQKHFPGLYADEDLGCMVFHVCALTDDGLIMKSFLCPESTLFDQTILKCNWWFYVDCKSSHKLYDSNIPISKSYQLMKALAFFSSYNNKNKK